MTIVTKDSNLLGSFFMAGDKVVTTSCNLKCGVNWFDPF
ncbi:hypothetical protein PPEP_b0110 [Pseudoalteromonas peptidolytica F12-50-A1]|uniref:Uncharacterized protein n=1 Tax=Pseudoalteromonas peptidolytica F12-50-A1 TaxID=1315280 RepID=A0A8I0MZY9_9GAMM|nr:hypothetical protein [Pseudoalteromonas peptidolytica F12-50-A1]